MSSFSRVPLRWRWAGAGFVMAIGVSYAVRDLLPSPLASQSMTVGPHPESPTGAETWVEPGARPGPAPRSPVAPIARSAALETPASLGETEVARADVQTDPPPARGEGLAETTTAQRVAIADRALTRQVEVRPLVGERSERSEGSAMTQDRKATGSAEDSTEALLSLLRSVNTKILGDVPRTRATEMEPDARIKKRPSAARTPELAEMERECRRASLLDSMPPSYCNCDVGEFEQMECSVSAALAKN